MLEIISMKTNFWFVVLSPFVSAVVAFATADAVSRRSWINSRNRPSASIWDVC